MSRISSFQVTHTVYNRMSLLLKSLVTVARVTPAYRLSRFKLPTMRLIFKLIYFQTARR